jgi:small GTP-binding protein
MSELPVVAIVGRPNVGKSTLLNRIVGRREAIVEERPGVTRDRKVVDAEWQGQAFQLVDTGGWMPGGDALDEKVSRQSEKAIAEADAVILVVDVTMGVTEEDARIAELLHGLSQPVFVLANKVSNLLPVTGDIHNFFVGTATTDGSDTGTPVCGEFVGGSTTSLGLPEETGIPSSTIKGLISTLDHHITYTDLDHRGYAVLEITPTQATCEFKRVQTQTRDRGQATSMAKFSLPSGSTTPQQIG